MFKPALNGAKIKPVTKNTDYLRLFLNFVTVIRFDA